MAPLLTASRRSDSELHCPVCPASVGGSGRAPQKQRTRLQGAICDSALEMPKLWPRCQRIEDVLRIRVFVIV